MLKSAKRERQVYVQLVCLSCAGLQVPATLDLVSI